MASAPLRNPLVGFVLAILIAALLSGVAGFASTFVPYMEFRIFSLGLGLCGIGALAGRRTYLGSLGFMGAYLGSFVGFYLAEVLFWVRPGIDILLLATALALAAGLGGWVTGKVGAAKLDRASKYAPGVRRCGNCGARVGTSAHKCWSCKATLTY